MKISFPINMNNQYQTLQWSGHYRQYTRLKSRKPHYSLKHSDFSVGGEPGGNTRDIFFQYTFSGVIMKVIFGLKNLKTIFSQ